MGNGKDNTVGNGIQEFRAILARDKRSSLCFIVTGHCQCDEVWMVEIDAECMRYGVANLSARCFWDGVAANTFGKGEVLEEALHPLLIFALIWIYFGVDSLKVGVG